MMVSVEEKNVDRYLEAQVEEIEVLRSIYGDSWKVDNEADRSYSIEIKEDDLLVTLYVTLPKNYPYDCPPTFTISAPKITRECKQHLNNLLQEVYLQNIGQTVLFQWVDKIKEYLSILVLSIENPVEDTPEAVTSGSKAHANEKQILEIIHGGTIVDRKSTFQGHVALVKSVNDVRSVLDELKSNRKIASATHNIFAYRISHTKESVIQDYDDDGETSAGGRLLHLLQILNAINVIVIVSRWYGGIHLGSARFSHINNAARKALDEAGIIKNIKKKA